MSDTSPHPQARADKRGLAAPLWWGALCLACVWGFWATGRLHGGYRISVVALEHIPGSELVFYAWQALWGIPACLFGARALAGSGLTDALALGLLRGCDTRPRFWVGLAALCAFVFALVFYLGLTQGMPLSDDENAYVLVARTLLAGRVSNPPPPVPELFENVFVIANGRGWYGKYPIGHPLLLALGEALGLRALVVPSLAALNLWLTFRIGRVFFDRRTAFFGALLLLLSPHFIWTHGTQLSQPSSMTCMLLAILATERAIATAGIGWALLAGLCLGFGVLVRPMPGALFLPAVAIAFAAHAMAGSPESARQRRWVQLLLAALVALLLASVLLLVHQLQSGHALESGYHTEVAPGTSPESLVLAGSKGAWAASLGGGMLRESFWFLGFPLSAAVFFWARIARLRVLFWGLLLSLAVYRVLVPKTVMSVTGPIYLTEALPLISLATVDVLRRWSARWTGGHGAGGLSVAVVAAGLLVSATMFLPVQARPITTATALRGRVYALLRERGAGRALVFANHLVRTDDRRLWAYFPPNPSPDLSDDIIFVRLPQVRPERLEAAARSFWRAHMSDRRAFVFIPEREPPELIELH